MTLPAHQSVPLPSTWVGYLWRTEPRLFLLAGFFKFAWSATIITAAFYFVEELTSLSLLSAAGTGRREIELFLGYLATIIGVVVSYQMNNLVGSKLGSIAKARLSALVAEHALLRGSTAASDRALALVLSSMDTNNICEGAKVVWQLPSAVCEGFTIIGLLVYRTGRLAGGISAGLLVVGFAALFYMSIKMTQFKNDVGELEERQVSLFYEILRNIRPFKFYGWDVFFLERLNRLTSDLAPFQSKVTLLKAVNMTVVICFPCICAIIIFLSQYYSTGVFNDPLMQSNTLALLNTFRYPLFNLPASLRAMASASASYARIKQYFDKATMQDTRDASASPGTIEVNNLPVGPHGSVLKQLRIKRGDLLILQGNVKSFKSTVLRTLAGTYAIPLNSSVRFGGRVSYAPQEPWMCQTTIQDNIVMFEAYDSKRYNDVLFACALTQDLAIMPLGDQTPVAEKGISLSGGQRQRVALARAAYRIAEIYLFDNPISALDDGTQEHVWEHLVEGLLRKATVVVASSRSVRSCSTILHLCDKGVQGELENVAGWVDRTTTSALPLRYTPDRSTSSVASSHSEHAQLPPRITSQGALERASVQDVSEEIKLFRSYADRSSGRLSIRSSIASFLRPESRPESRVSRETEMHHPPAATAAATRVNLSDEHDFMGTNLFLDELDKKRQQSGMVSARSYIGSRRVSYKEFVQNQSNGEFDEQVRTVQRGAASHATRGKPKSLKAPLLEVEGDASAPAAASAPTSKSTFAVWIQCAGLSKTYLFVLLLLYVWFPFPRIWFDLWIGYWSEKKYSSNDNFNVNVFVISFIGVVLCRFVPDFMAFYLGAKAASNLRRSISRTVVYAPMRFFLTENLGPLIGVFSKDLSVVSDELIQDVHTGIVYISLVFLICGYVCSQFPYFIPVFAAVLAILVWIQSIYLRKITLIRGEFQKAQDDVFHTLSDCLEGIEILRCAGREQWAIELLSEEFKRNRIATVAVDETNIWVARRADSLGIILAFCQVLFCEYFDVPLVPKGVIIRNTLSILVLLSWSIKLISNAQFLLSSVHRINGYVDSVTSENKSGSSLDVQWPSKGDIEFKQMSLRYSAVPGQPLALDDVSFKLPPGSKVGVVGRTGSGKSTLVVALFRLIEPCGGSMVVGGTCIDNVTVDPLRQQLAIIPQDPSMFQGTLRLNLDPLNLYTDAQVDAAIKQVGLAASRNMNSTVALSGEDWSLGERQLVSERHARLCRTVAGSLTSQQVCLARVLLKRPKILCLDEATASLDAQTEILFQKVLEEGFADATIFCIAHRIDTLAWCRTRIEMRAGRLLSMEAIGGKSAAD